MLAVVDPGVGSSRKAIAIEVADGEAVFVGPDNGLLAPAVAMAGGAGRRRGADQRGVPPAVARGRRSPAATSSPRSPAHLCNGVDLAELGAPIDADELLPGMVPLPREEAEGLVGEVLWVDHFGNCQLNIGPDEIADWGAAAAGHASANRNASPPASRTFADVGHGRRRSGRRQLRDVGAGPRPALGGRGAAASAPATRSRWRR